MRRRAPPVEIGREGLVDNRPVTARGLVPEPVLDAIEAVPLQQPVGGRVVQIRIGSDEVMVARHGQKLCAARSEFVEALPKGVEEVPLHRLEFFGRAGLHQVAGEQHRIPGAAELVESLKIVEKGPAQVRPQVVLLLEAVVQVRQVQPGEVVVGHGLPLLAIARRRVSEGSPLRTRCRPGPPPG